MLILTLEDLYFLLGAMCLSVLLLGGGAATLVVIVRLVQHETRMRDSDTRSSKERYYDQ